VLGVYLGPLWQYVRKGAKEPLWRDTLGYADLQRVMDGIEPWRRSRGGEEAKMDLDCSNIFLNSIGTTGRKKKIHLFKGVVWSYAGEGSGKRSKGP